MAEKRICQKPVQLLANLIFACGLSLNCVCVISPLVNQPTVDSSAGSNRLYTAIRKRRQCLVSQRRYTSN